MNISSAFLHDIRAFYHYGIFFFSSNNVPHFFSWDYTPKITSAWYLHQANFKQLSFVESIGYSCFMWLWTPWIREGWSSNADQLNTKCNHANDPLEVPIGPIARARAKKLKEALNEHVQNIWSKNGPKGAWDI
jgi:hypothetical protein